MIVVAAPNARGAPVLSVTAGAVAGAGEEPAPPNVSDLSPAYDAATLPNASRAVIVRSSPLPAVGDDVDAARSNEEIGAGETATVSRSVPVVASPALVATTCAVSDL